MRSHRDIVQGFGAAALARALKEKGVVVSASTPQRWVERNSIPGEYWETLVELNVASREELAQAADVRRRGAEPMRGAA